MANFKKLSAYTIAKYCSDITDVKDGMTELQQYFSACQKVGKKPADSAYIRYSKLADKLAVLSK